MNVAEILSLQGNANMPSCLTDIIYYIILKIQNFFWSPWSSLVENYRFYKLEIFTFHAQNISKL